MDQQAHEHRERVADHVVADLARAGRDETAGRVRERLAAEPAGLRRHRRGDRPARPAGGRGHHRPPLRHARRHAACGGDGPRLPEGPPRGRPGARRLGGAAPRGRRAAGGRRERRAAGRRAAAGAAAGAPPRARGGPAQAHRHRPRDVARAPRDRRSADAPRAPTACPGSLRGSREARRPPPRWPGSRT
ncbi:MAG: hypothetical protein MZW92_62470 [Comamonadaceae bacterium]|nr:hypothetical protein [Comamonadaceae bacterium]